LKYHNTLEKLSQIKIFSQEKLNNLNAICKDFPFKANDYYLNLINWEDTEDPIKRIIFPCEEESLDWGEYDASNESSITVDKGVQHKYPYTVLLLCNEECGGYCRYCFRKRVFLRENNEVSLDVKEGIKYISENPQVTNVLLTGGDPLLLSNDKLVEILSEIRKIDHVGIIRIGSKLPAFNPMRIYEDYELLDILKEFSTAEKRIYLMTHFDHPRELTKEAQKAIKSLINVGAVLCNQSPLITGLGGLISGILVFKFAPETQGSGIPYVKLTLARIGKGTRIRSIFVKFFAGLAGIGTGLSLGREGPSIQLGAGAGALVAKMFKMRGTEQDELIAAEAGAAIGATFNAPIAGTIFVLEELVQGFSPSLLFPVLVATVTASTMARHFLEAILRLKSLI